MISSNAFKKDFYTVTIVDGGRAYFYLCFCPNHEQALVMASADHIAAYGLRPSLTSIKADGPCHKSDCDCGQPSTAECVKCTETDDLDLMN